MRIRDLLYKPIVLSCDHVSCFWCVHKSMDGLRESHCPVCRNTFYYFPKFVKCFSFCFLRSILMLTREGKIRCLRKMWGSGHLQLSCEVLKCEVCQSQHPKGFPKVCLAVHFLEEQFPEEYAKRRDAVQLSQLKVKPDTTSCSLDDGKGEKIGWWWCDTGFKVHRGAGCDFCGGML
ncbi:unnamed protein product [Lupinus luteus]|uniref:RING-type domain-containing protein n=1 Tax=Lupinus luteus TaxID=3873 RepID=A0AAV1WBU3_LUPLU